MSDYYCPQCGADLGDQPGFDPNAGYWTCTECGQFLTDPGDESDELDRFENVGWFCDECGAFLNKQSGFSDWYSSWTCTECGHVNNLSEDDIYVSEDSYQASRAENDSDYEDEDDEDEDDEDDDDEDEEYEDEEYEDEDNVVEYDDNDDVEIETYFDSEEYKKQVQAEAGKREELERQLEEQRRNKEEKRRERLEQRKEQRKRLWRTVTGKKQVIGLSSEQCQHMRYEEVFNLLKSREFYNISIVGSEDLTLDDLSQEGIVQRIIINGTDTFDESSTFPFNAKINIVYHMLKTAFPPLTSKYAKRMDVDDVVWEFENAGFQYVFREAIPDLKKGWLVKEDSVEQVTINGRTDFKKRERFRVDAKIVVSYHTFKKIR